MHTVVSTIASAAAIGAAAAVFGSGIAIADPDVTDAVGRRYSEAKAAFNEANMTPVVASTVGDKLPQDQCWVVSVSRATFLAQGGASRGDVVQVSLNCYPKPATGLNPGFSAGNNAPDAQAVRETSEQEALEWRKSAQGQRWCESALGKHPEWAPIEGC